MVQEKSDYLITQIAKMRQQIALLSKEKDSTRVEIQSSEYSVSVKTRDEFSFSVPDELND
jgi:hypothetical protein